MINARQACISIFPPLFNAKHHLPLVYKYPQSSLRPKFGHAFQSVDPRATSRHWPRQQAFSVTAKFPLNHFLRRQT